MLRSGEQTAGWRLKFDGSGSLKRLWEAGSEDEVRAAIGTLPIFRVGMLEIVILVSVKSYPGFEPAK